jgi:hypothetical protein
MGVSSQYLPPERMRTEAAGKEIVNASKEREPAEFRGKCGKA